MLPLLLATMGSADPRLDLKATLLQARVTYAELGAWVQRSTGVPILVAPVIRERKATVLVEDRPVRETMDRVAEALFLEWAPMEKGGGYTLRLAPKVASEEAGIAAVSSQASYRAIQQRMDDLARFASFSKEDLKAEREKDNTEAIALDKETAPALRLRRAELIDRARVVGSLEQGQIRAQGLLLATLTPVQRQAILDGEVFYASNQPGPGIAAAPREAITALAENYGMVSPDRPVRFSFYYDPTKSGLAFSHGVSDKTSASGGTSIEQGIDSMRAREARAASPFGKRLAEWAKTDPDLLATKLVPKKEEPFAKRQTPYKTLADLLVDLHARTGLPIVADGFRLAVVAKRLPDGADVASWQRSLATTYLNGSYVYRGYQPFVRAQSGWMMMRYGRYWLQLAREVPEAPIRRLEEAAKSGRVTLDDVTAFGAAVSPAQEPWLEGDQLVMNAPSAAVAGKIRFLRLWASLPTALRKSATSKQGLPIRALSPASSILLMACLQERRGSVFGFSDVLPYLLPGAPSFPDDVRLFVNLNANTQNQEYEEFDPEHPGTGWNSMRDGVPGVYATIGVPGGPTFQSYQVPLRPSRKLWPDDPPKESSVSTNEMVAKRLRMPSCFFRRFSSYSPLCNSAPYGSTVPPSRERSSPRR